MMAVAIERYITVCHPFFKITHNWGAYKSVPHLFFITSTKFFVRYILPIFSFSLVYNVPKFFELKAEGVPGEHGLIDRDPLEVHWAHPLHILCLCPHPNTTSVSTVSKLTSTSYITQLTSPSKSLLLLLDCFSLFKSQTIIIVFEEQKM